LSIYLHSKLSDECILGYLDLKQDLLTVSQQVFHTACDDCGSIVAGDRRVNVEAVNILFLY